MKGLVFEKDDSWGRARETRVAEFACICHKCGSADVTLEYTFEYYGAATGYDQDITIRCRNCDNNRSMPI